MRDPQAADDWAKQGVELHRGDLTDAATFAAALEGIEGAFLMQPTPRGATRDFPEAKALDAAFCEALRQASPPCVVFLSAVGSEKSEGLGNIMQTHLREEAVGDLLFPTAFLRAGSLLENYLHDLKKVASTGFFDSFLQPANRSFPMVATVDVGAEAARLLVDSWQGRKTVELGSRYTLDELAVAIGEALGRKVLARAIPRGERKAALHAMGLPPEHMENWEEMQDGFNSGWIDFGVPVTEPVPGATSSAQFFACAHQAQE